MPDGFHKDLDGNLMLQRGPHPHKHAEEGNRQSEEGNRQ